MQRNVDSKVDRVKNADSEGVKHSAMRVGDLPAVQEADVGRVGDGDKVAAP